MNMDNDIHYLLGQLSMADEIIEELSHYKSKPMKQRLKEAKAARQEVMEKISRVARGLSGSAAR